MIAREGYSIILLLGMAALAAGLAYGLLWPRWYFLAGAWLFASLTFFAMFFFRDPERKVRAGENSIVAPADGRILEITEEEEPAFCQERMQKISIFLSLFNVHITACRFPAKWPTRNISPDVFLTPGSRALPRKTSRCTWAWKAAARSCW